MISDIEREKMLKAFSIGSKMIDYLEQSGIETLAELCGKQAQDIAFQIEIETGTRLNKMGVDALRNLIALADEQH